MKTKRTRTRAPKVAIIIKNVNLMQLNWKIQIVVKDKCYKK